MLNTPIQNPISEQQYQNRIQQLEYQVFSLQEHIKKLNEMITNGTGVVVVPPAPSSFGNVFYSGRHPSTLPVAASESEPQARQYNNFYHIPADSRGTLKVEQKTFSAAKEVSAHDKMKPQSVEDIHSRYNRFAKKGDLKQLNALEEEFGKIADDKIGDNTRLNALKISLTEQNAEIVKLIVTNITYARQMEAISLVTQQGNIDCIVGILDVLKSYQGAKGRIVDALYSHHRSAELVSILENKDLVRRIQTERGLDSVFIRAARAGDLQTLNMLYAHVESFAKQQAYAVAKERNIKPVLEYFNKSTNNGLDIESIIKTTFVEGKTGKEMLWKLDALWFPAHVERVLKQLECNGEHEMVAHLRKTYLAKPKEVVITAKTTTTQTKTQTEITTEQAPTDSQPALVFSRVRNTSSTKSVEVQMSPKSKKLKENTDDKQPKKEGERPKDFSIRSLLN